MTFKWLKFEKADPGIQLIKIARPESLNALNKETLIELKSALATQAETPTTRVLILTGEGEKAFVAGADIHELKNQDPSQAIHFAQLGHEVAKQLELMPQPTIAAVNGYALGGGLEMALACDFILAAENAIFGLPEVGLGIIPGFGGTFRLAKSIGLPRAKELIYSGRKLSAQEALDLGLVNHVYPKSDFRTKVIEVAQLISQQSQGAIRRAKLLMNEFSETSGLHFKMDAETQAFGRLFSTDDQREGMAAFVDRRKPKFMGL